MKILISFGLICLFNFSVYSQTINDSCETSLPFCTGMIYNFPAGVNSGSGQVGPNYGCVFTTPNPAWYYMNILQPGVIEIEMHSVPQADIDFVVWGPFMHNTAPCSGDLTAGATTPSHDVTGPSLDYPSGNMIDCSYSPNFQEYIYIPNALPGEYYIVLITNFSNQVCNIIFNQTNIGQAGAGVTNCQGLATAEGIFFYDENHNNVFDPTESLLSGAMVYSPSCNLYFMSDNVGHYGSYVCAVPDSIIGYYNHPHITSISPTGYYIQGATTQANFAVDIDNVNDLAVSVVNITPFVPGFTCGMNISVANEGVLQNGGLMTMEFDSSFTYSYSVPPADSVAGNTIYWNTPLIAMLDYFSANAYFDVDSTLLSGMPYTFNGEIVSTLVDTILANNVVVFNDTLVSSFDPNDKNVNPSGMIDNAYAGTSPDFEYIVRFQNTGTYFATDIKITDTLSSWLDIPSFNLISSSHPCTYEIKGSGIVEFTFHNINLPASMDNEPGSHGFVKFSVKCRHELDLGGDVYNKAYIFFDYNLPILTNTVLTFTRFITDAGFIPPKEVMKQVGIYPNPASSDVTVTFPATTKKSYMEISDIAGKVVMTLPLLKSQNNLKIDVSNLQSGSYNITINTGKDKFTEKLVVE